MTNKLRQHPRNVSAIASRPKTLMPPSAHVIVPLCGGVVSAIPLEDIEPLSTPGSLETLAANSDAASPGATLSTTVSTAVYAHEVSNFAEAAIALLICGTILGWLTTVPLWLPQVMPQPYSKLGCIPITQVGHHRTVC